jgi:serine/threonine protein kinase
MNTLSTPQQFGKYRLIEQLAAGGMAEVFLAVAQGDAGFVKPVVIKRLHKHLGSDSQFIQMMIDEARITSQLNHGNICQVLDLGAVEGDYYIAMEYVSGEHLGTLQDRARRLEIPIPPEAVVHILCEVLAGLDYAHRKRGSDGHPLKIIHRDVSPQNVLVSFEGDVKIIDFGIAKARLRQVQTEAGIIKGKFRYMSPEQAAGEEIDQRTDVFAAGVVLYELLRGEPHSLDLSDGAVLRKMRRADFEPLPRPVPALLRAALTRALERFPGDRFSSAAEFRAALLDVLRQHGRGFDRTALAALMQRVFDDAWRSRRSASRPGLLELDTDPATSPYLDPGRMPGAPTHALPLDDPQGSLVQASQESLAQLSTVHLIPLPDPSEVPPPPPEPSAAEAYEAPEHLPADTDQTRAYYPPPRPSPALAPNLDTDPATIVPALETDRATIARSLESDRATLAKEADTDRATIAKSADTDRATYVREPAPAPFAPGTSDPVFELHREPTPIARVDAPAAPGRPPPRPAPRAASSRLPTEVLGGEPPPRQGQSGLFARQATLAPVRSGELFSDQAALTRERAPVAERPRRSLRIVAQGLVLGVLLAAGGYGLYFLTRPLPEETPPATPPALSAPLASTLPDLGASPAGEPRPRRLGKLYIGSKPAGARITICGQRDANLTPATLEIDADRPCTLVLELDGFAAYATQVQAIAGQQTTVVATLRRLE